MYLLFYPLLFFVSFGGTAVLFCSAIALAIWTFVRLLRALFRLPRALRERPKRSRQRRAIEADLMRLKRAGA